MSATKKKPKCRLIGEDSNIFNLASIARKTLRKNGMKAEGEEMIARVTKCDSYEDALGVIGEYVTII